MIANSLYFGGKKPTSRKALQRDGDFSIVNKNSINKNVLHKKAVRHRVDKVTNVSIKLENKNKLDDTFEKTYQNYIKNVSARNEKTYRDKSINDLFGPNSDSEEEKVFAEEKVMSRTDFKSTLEDDDTTMDDVKREFELRPAYKDSSDTYNPGVTYQQISSELGQRRAQKNRTQRRKQKRAEVRIQARRDTTRNRDLKKQRQSFEFNENLRVINDTKAVKRTKDDILLENMTPHELKMHKLEIRKKKRQEAKTQSVAQKKKNPAARSAVHPNKVRKLRRKEERLLQEAENDIFEHKMMAESGVAEPLMFAPYTPDMKDPSYWEHVCELLGDVGHSMKAFLRDAFGDMFSAFYSTLAYMGEYLSDLLNGNLIGLITYIHQLSRLRDGLEFWEVTNQYLGLVRDKELVNYFKDIVDIVASYWPNMNSESGMIEDAGIKVDQFRGFLEKTFNGELSQAIQSLIVAAIAAKMVGPSAKSWIKHVLGKPRPMTMIQIACGALAGLSIILKFGGGIAQGKSFSSLFFADDPVKAFMSKTSDLLYYSDKLFTGLPIEGMKDRAMYVIELKDLIDQGDNLMKIMRSTDDRIKDVKIFHLKLRSAYLDIHRIIMTENRKAPVAIVISGPPSIGKSAILKVPSHIWSDVKGRRYDDSHMWSMCTSSDYCDGYNYQPIVHVSEVGNESLQVAITQPPKLLGMVCSMVDVLPYPMNMSSVEDKGKYFFNSELLLVDTNNAKMHTDSLCHCPAAIMRRFLHIECQVHPDFLLSQDGVKTTAIDSEKSKAVGGNLLDRYIFNVIEYKPISGGYHPSYVVKNGDIYQMSDYLRFYFKRHIQHSEYMEKADLYSWIYQTATEEKENVECKIDSGLEGEFDFLKTTFHTQEQSNPKFYQEYFDAVKDYCERFSDYVFSIPESFRKREKKAELPTYDDYQEYYHSKVTPDDYLNFPYTECSQNKQDECPNNLSAPMNNPAGNEDFDFKDYDPSDPLMTTEAGESDPHFLKFCKYIHALQYKEFTKKMLNDKNKLDSDINKELKNGGKSWGDRFRDIGRFFKNVSAYLGFQFLIGLLRFYLMFGAHLVKIFFIVLIAPWLYIRQFVFDPFCNMVDACVMLSVLFALPFLYWMQATGWLTRIILERKLYDWKLKKETRANLIKYLTGNKEVNSVFTCWSGTLLVAAIGFIVFVLRQWAKHVKHDVQAEAACSKFIRPSDYDSKINEIEEQIGCEHPRMGIRNVHTPTWNVMNGVLEKMPHRTGLDGLQNLIANNIYFIHIRAKNIEKVYTGFIFGICKNFAVINSHSIALMEDPELEFSRTGLFNEPHLTFRVQLTSSHIYDVGGDVTLIRCDSLRFRNILPHIINSDLKTYTIAGLLEDRFRAYPSGSHSVSDKRIGTYILPETLSYHVEHFAGLCGYPIIAEVGAGANGIVAIHAAGDKHSDLCYGIPLNRGKLQLGIDYLEAKSPLITVFSEGGITPHRELPGVHSPFRHLYLPYLEYFGKEEGAVLIKNKSKLKLTGFAKPFKKMLSREFNFEQDTFFDRPMMQPQGKGENYISPYNITLNKMNNAPKMPNYKVLEKCIKVYTDHILTELRKQGVTELKPLSMIEAVNGINGHPYINRINPSTSAGHGFPGYKFQYIPEEDEKLHIREPVDSLRERVTKVFERYDAEECYNFIYKASLKDEPRETTKCKLGKTRVFYMSPIDNLVVSKMLLAPFYALMMEFHEAFGCALGINMYTAGGEFYNLMNDFSCKIIEGDFGSFDIRRVWFIAQAVYTVTYNVVSALGYNARALKSLNGLMSDKLHCMVNMCQELFTRVGFQPSGGDGTAQDNCMANVLMNMYCWYMNPNLENINFFDAVKIRTFGDDLIESILEPYDQFFNANTLAVDCTRYFDIEFTNAAKSLNFPDTITMDEASFLKRSFRYHYKGPRVAQIDMNSIVKAVEWCLPSSAITFEEQARSTMVAMCYELYLYSTSDDQYERIRLEIATMLFKHFGGDIGEFLDVLPSLDMCVDVIFPNGVW